MIKAEFVLNSEFKKLLQLSSKETNWNTHEFYENQSFKIASFLFMFSYFCSDKVGFATTLAQLSVFPFYEVYAKI